MIFQRLGAIIVFCLITALCSTSLVWAQSQNASSTAWAQLQIPIQDTQPTPNFNPKSYDTLKELETLAQQQLDDGNPDSALETYRQYERLMIESGYDVLFPDLLMNQAITAYHAGRYGASLAYLKQLIILNKTPQHQRLKNEIQTLLEHKLYQQSPNRMFVRGTSQEHAFWQLMHSRSPEVIRAGRAICWSIFWICVSLLIIHWRRSKRKVWNFLCVVLLFVLALSFINIEHHFRHSLELTYGVLLDDFTIHVMPFNEAQTLTDKGFISGMTVKVIQHESDWVKVQRVDGITGWTQTQNLYILRPKGSHKPAQF